IWENHPRAPLPRKLSVHPRITVYRSHRNLGFAAAVNRAVRLLPRSVPYLWLLNPDAWPQEPDFLDRALDRMGGDPRIAVLTPRVVYPDGTPQPVVKQRAGVWEALFARTGVLGFLTGYHPPQPEDAGPVPFAAAVSWVIRRDVFQRLGGMDERYFLFYEDTDFCRNVREAGYIIWYEPSLTVVHRQGHARRDRMFWAQLHKVRSGLRFVSRKTPVSSWLQIGGIGLAGMYGLMHLFWGTWMKEVQHWNTLKKPLNGPSPSVRG
ncbi:MAG: glycosyltransferase family 2 protein, partial [Candidatus Hydrothermae bacterium]|nr:glycosyltransferase family 2 protein [Candidatus Hydrothermae bacterium]